MAFSASFLKQPDPPAPLFQEKPLSYTHEENIQDIYDNSYDDGSHAAAYLYGNNPENSYLSTHNDGLSALGGEGGGTNERELYESETSQIQKGLDSVSSSNEYAWAAGSAGPNGSHLQPPDMYRAPLAPTYQRPPLRDPRRDLLPADVIPPSLKSQIPYQHRYRDAPFAVLYVFAMVVWFFVGVRLVFSTTSYPLKGYDRATAFAAIRDTSGLFAFLIGCSIAGGAAWIWWLRKFVKPFVWATLTCMPFVAFTLFFWSLIESFHSGLNRDGTVSDTHDGGMTFVSFIPLVLGLFWGRTVWKKREQINKTVAIVELSCEILRSQPTILVYSFFLLVAYTLFSLLWIAFFSRLLLLGKFTGNGLVSSAAFALVARQLNDTMPSDNATDGGKHATNPVPVPVIPDDGKGGNWVLDSEAYWAIAFFVIIFFWTSAVFGNLQRVGISGVVGDWYFHRNDPPDESLPLLVDGSFLYQSPEERPADTPYRNIEMYAFEKTPTHVAFQRGATTLFGSACLGGLVLGCVRILQIGVGMLRKYFRNHRSGSGVLTAIGGIIAFIDGLIESINNYTLIYVGLTGEGFCTSARHATKVFRRNLMSGIITDLITRLVLYLLAFTMAAVSGLTMYVFATHALHNPFAWVVSALALIVPAYIGVFWGRVLTNTIDATFMAYAIDMDIGTNHCPAAHKIFGETGNVI